MFERIKEWWSGLRAEPEVREPSGVQPDLVVQTRASVDEHWAQLQEGAQRLVRARYKTYPPAFRDERRARLEELVREKLGHHSFLSEERVERTVVRALHHHNLMWEELDEALWRDGTPDPPPPSLWEHLDAD